MDKAATGSLTTPLCELLGIRYPIIQAPMAGGPTTAALVAAVSNAGGLGMLAASRVPLEQLKATIREIRRLTDKPFGVNFLLAGPPADLAAALERDREMRPVLDRVRGELGLAPGGELTAPPATLAEGIDVTLEEAVPVFSVALGDSTPWVSEARAAGAKVIAMVTTVDEARQVVAGGADVVVAQGAEAGGHRSTFTLGEDEEPPLVGTLALVPQVVDAVDVPVVAAGGVADGRGIAAALALGAAGAQLGTRFLATREAGIPEAYKQRLLAARETDSVVTRNLSGRPARSLRNRMIAEIDASGVRPLAYPLQSSAAGDIYRAAMQAGQTEYFPLWAGQGAGMVDDIPGAGELVAELVAETRAVLSRLGRLA